LKYAQKLAGICSKTSWHMLKNYLEYAKKMTWNMLKKYLEYAQKLPGICSKTGGLNKLSFLPQRPLLRYSSPVKSEWDFCTNKFQNF
jgi:hypothetical protein